MTEKPTLAIKRRGPDDAEKSRRWTSNKTRKIKKDPGTKVSQKLNLYDIQSKYGTLHTDIIKEIAANPRKALKESNKKVKIQNHTTDALTKRLIEERIIK